MRKKTKHSKKYYWYFTMFFLGIYFSFQYLRHYEGIVSKTYSEFLLNLEFSDQSILESFENLDTEQKESKKQKEEKEVEEEVLSPKIYLYNSHPLEKYASNVSFSFYPNVTMVNSILKGQFERGGFSTLSEERSVSDLLNQNSWNYASSYRASRIYLEDTKQKYPTLEYFIDIHRDSLKHSRTTVLLEDKSYATLLFLIGMENPKYESNLRFTERIVDKLNSKYPNICKGIMKKRGPGVNGVYNQDFSPNAILLEVGGEENTASEVLNSSLAFAECFMEVLHEG